MRKLDELLYGISAVKKRMGDVFSSASVFQIYFRYQF